MKQRKSIFAYLFGTVLILTVLLTAYSYGGSASDSTTSSSSSSAATGSSSSAAESASQEQPSSSASPKILVAYFSQTGNTHKIATQIHDQVGGDLFRIETAVPYPSDMALLVKRKNQELKSGNMPELKAKVENIESYDVVFLGYPIWSMTTPPPVRSFIENNDLIGKTIIPFCTHDGFGPGSSVDSIKGLLPDGTKVLDVFDIKGSEGDGAGPLIHSWLKEIGIISKGESCN